MGWFTSCQMTQFKWHWNLNLIRIKACGQDKGLGIAMLKIFRGRWITKRLRLSRLGCFVRKLPVVTARVFSVGLSSDCHKTQCHECHVPWWWWWRRWQKSRYGPKCAIFVITVMNHLTKLHDCHDTFKFFKSLITSPKSWHDLMTAGAPTTDCGRWVCLEFVGRSELVPRAPTTSPRSHVAGLKGPFFATRIPGVTQNVDKTKSHPTTIQKELQTTFDVKYQYGTSGLCQYFCIRVIPVLDEL